MYLARFAISEEPDEGELPGLLRAERARFGELVEQGRMEAGYVATDGSGGWLVVREGSREEAERTLESFPLRKFWEVEMTEVDRIPAAR